MDALLLGAKVTLELVTVSMALAGLLGVLFGVARISPIKSLQRMVAVYVEVTRSIPITVIMVFMYFALPEIGIVLPAFWAAVVALSVYHAAFIVEAIRSGVNSIDPGHIHAARSLGMGYGLTVRKVVLPLGIRNMLLPIGNIFIDTLKRSSVAYTISVMEITGVATNLATRLAEGAAFFLAAAVTYLVLTAPVGLLFQWADRTYGYRR